MTKAFLLLLLGFLTLHFSSPAQSAKQAAEGKYDWFLVCTPIQGMPISHRPKTIPFNYNIMTFGYIRFLITVDLCRIKNH